MPWLGATRPLPRDGIVEEFCGDPTVGSRPKIWTRDKRWKKYRKRWRAGEAEMRDNPEREELYLVPTPHRLIMVVQTAVPVHLSKRWVKMTWKIPQASNHLIPLLGSFVYDCTLAQCATVHCKYTAWNYLNH